MRPSLLAMLMIPALAGATDLPAGGRVVDEVVALVSSRGEEARIITLSRVVEEGRVVLVSRGGIEAAFAPLDGATLRASLDWYVDQLLLHDEAVRLKVFEIDRETASSALAQFRKEFANPRDFETFLAAIDATEEDVLAILRRTLRVRRYLESRLGRLRPTPTEIAAWRRAHPEEVVGKAPGQDTEEISARLVALRADRETRALIADLRSRADVRILVNLDAPP